MGQLRAVAERLALARQAFRLCEQAAEQEQPPAEQWVLRGALLVQLAAVIQGLGQPGGRDPLAAAAALPPSAALAWWQDAWQHLLGDTLLTRSAAAPETRNLIAAASALPLGLAERAAMAEVIEGLAIRLQHLQSQDREE
ncbi:hypothetical protein [Isoalcanivorax beigongshangi]|uniref:Uncharacterized protein n=1 Tax=Isoalcanivorax beigongshangi TaxID=3238810 RepID=A0ABV4AH49_9GAMM